ncbi:LCP family protein [Pantanalinema sp. GBBB05]|uniref:LCP family protein n=1 Tax=Pantanalinema sp. GBBB05 TaxID=2604139 RepID=UPI001DC79FB3|nr:LytR family transcriptional regulator [Pantanalinema sp. GBBB05]
MSLPSAPPSSDTPWIVRGLAIAAAAVTSAALGLVMAFLVPLPTGILSKEKTGGAEQIWRSGFGYHVSRPVNILVMGIDRVPEAKPGSPEMFNGRSDTMLLLRVDPLNDSVSLLSIPRDTQVELENVGMTKINDANVRGGATLAAQTVSGMLNGVQIDRYVRVSTDAFRELVDLIGGVEVNVPQAMSYEDKTQKLKIELSPGLQTLNGDQAEQFARFRYDGYGDIGRVQRQQALLRALRKQVTNPMIIPRIPSLIQAMQKYVDTNLSFEEMLALVSAGRRMSEGEFKMVMLPGRFSAPDEFVASYWIMNLEGRDRVMKQYFEVEPVTTTTATSRSADTLRIALQNASGTPGVTYQVQAQLAKLGFHNVYIVEQATQVRPETRIIVQQGDLDAAQEIQNKLGFGKVEADSTGELESDLTIKVGADWKNLSKQTTAP